MLGTIDVWEIDLASTASLPAYLDVLDSHERSRAVRFYSGRERGRYVIAHGAIRFILATYLGESPASIRYAMSTHGKPRLESRSGPTFNLSHSYERALFAVAPHGDVGVDIEFVRPIEPAEILRLSDRWFSELEHHCLSRLRPDALSAAFFTCWTRKEAYLKAKGLGLSLPLNSFSVEPRPDQPAKILASRSHPEDLEAYSLADITVGEHYRATLACRSPVSPPVVRRVCPAAGCW